jgi:RecG-like helicase
MNSVFTKNDIDGHLIRAMANAVLEQAVRDFYDLVRSEKRIKTIYAVLQEMPGDDIDQATCRALARLRETVNETIDSAAWLESNDERMNTFVWCCHMLDMDVEQTRHEALTCEQSLRRRLAHRSAVLKGEQTEEEQPDIVQQVRELVEEVCGPRQVELAL